MAKIMFIIVAITIIACSNEKPLPLMVQIDNCHELPCDVWKGTQSNIAVQFVATKKAMSQIKADVRFTTLGAHIPFELEEARSNVCKNLMYGAYCPLDGGEDVTYNLLMQVNEYKPEVPIKIEVNILDRSDNSVLACFVTDGRVRRNMGVHKEN